MPPSRGTEDFELFLHLLGYISPALVTWLGMIVGGMIVTAVVMGVAYGVGMFVYDMVKEIRRLM